MQLCDTPSIVYFQLKLLYHLTCEIRTLDENATVGERIRFCRSKGESINIHSHGVWRKYFDNTVYVNLETNLSVARYFHDDITPERLIRFLETTVYEEIIPDKTLIIFDEIQSCERALTALKYFCELAPEYHFAAAGSLLGIAINREKYSFLKLKAQPRELNCLYRLRQFLPPCGYFRCEGCIERINLSVIQL